MTQEDHMWGIEDLYPELRCVKTPMWVGDAVLLEVEGVMEFERSAVVDEEIWHAHWCWMCNADWRCHDGEACEVVAATEGCFGSARGPALSAQCPDHQWSADPEVRG